MPLLPPEQLDPVIASFRTHLNYIRRMNYLLNDSTITVSFHGDPHVDENAVARFRSLYSVTDRSIEMDVDLARENHSFAIVAAPWFSVKCYYALYYLESILVHRMDGSMAGFSNGGHTRVRRKMSDHLQQGSVLFSTDQLSEVRTLEECRNAPTIGPGQNARTNFWQQNACTDSMLKKLSEYKLHDAKRSRRWNLRTRAHQTERDEFIARERVTAIDFFYWYRIKANYRDLDYIDFENGIPTDEVVSYMESYYGAYSSYRSLLSTHCLA